MYKVTIIDKGIVVEFYFKNTVMLVNFCKLTDVPEEDIFKSGAFVHIDDETTIVIQETNMELVPSKIKM